MSGLSLVPVAAAAGESPEALGLSRRTVRIGVKARRPHDRWFVFGAQGTAIEPGKGSVGSAPLNASGAHGAGGCQSELLEFGTEADVHARPMHISSEDPSPQVTKWAGALRRMGNS